MIVGAGLGGCLLAHFLGERGYPVSVYERRSDPRAAGHIGGRSINLAISARGFHALDRGGLGDRMREHSIRMPGRMIHAVAAHRTISDPSPRSVPGTASGPGAPASCETSFQPYSRDPDRAIHSVSRSR